ncbi:hypothetical protein pdam_00014676, partial [Pocillopora damicornis]
MKRLPGRLANITIGHLPREISIIIHFFLLKGGVVSICERTNEWVHKNLQFAPEQRALLVWNSFHLTDSGERLLTPKHFDLAFIPSSLTPALQAPNKYLNMPFKTRDPAQYQAWMGNGPFMYLPSGK